jgi:hypothetical protein
MVGFYSPLDHFCNDTECNSVINETLLYRDTHHMNKNGSIYVGQFLDFDEFNLL